MKKITTVLALLGLALAAGGAWWWQNRPAAAPGLAGAGAGAAASGMPAAPGGARPAGAGPGSPGGPGGRPGGGGPVSVEVARAESVSLSDDVQAVGSLRSRQGVILRPEVSGRVAQLGFRDGQPVKRGQVLLQLDDALQRAQLQQAEAQATIARTNLQRSRELQAQNFVSQSAVDQNEAAVAVAESQVALARAQLARLRVVAPFDGMVGIRSVDVGDYIKDGAEIVSLEDLSALNMDFRLPERYLTRVRVGQPVEVVLDAVPGRVFQARVEALDAQVDSNGRALLVRARLDNPGVMLKPGMFARGRVVFSVREAAVMVPEEALVPEGGRQFLFKVVENPEGQRVSQRLQAQVGVRQAGRVEILEGLAAGDTVVTAGHARLLRGTALPVRVIDLAQAGTRPPAGPGGGAGGGAALGGAPAASAAARPMASPAGPTAGRPVAPG